VPPAVREKIKQQHCRPADPDMVRCYCYRNWEGTSHLVANLVRCGLLLSAPAIVVTWLVWWRRGEMRTKKRIVYLTEKIQIVFHQGTR